jgi:hypothetical protein
VTLIADLIGLETRKVVEDVRRLSKFAAGLNKTLRLLREQRRPTKKRKETEKFPADKKADLVKVLARRKFGSPVGSNPGSVRSSSRRSSKVIVPRQTKLTLDRASFSRSKTEGTTPTEFDFQSECFSVDDTTKPINFQPKIVETATLKDVASRQTSTRESNLSRPPESISGVILFFVTFVADNLAGVLSLPGLIALI